MNYQVPFLKIEMNDHKTEKGCVIFGVKFKNIKATTALIALRNI